VTALALPPAASAQYSLETPGGDSLVFSLAQVQSMLDTTRALRRNLEEDPAVLYGTLFGPTLAPADPGAWPWNAVRVQSDSTALIRVPGNLREAARAYENYAVRRMAVVRSRDPDLPCDSLIRWETDVVGSFVDGWIAARTLFGGPPFAPLDALAFARADGQLPAMLASLGDRAVGACAASWAERHPAALASWESWREERFPDTPFPSGVPAPPDSAPPSFPRPEPRPGPPGERPPGGIGSGEAGTP
jgi:hypothetical protein